jgi:hypothetical protein
MIVDVCNDRFSGICLENWKTATSVIRKHKMFTLEVMATVVFCGTVWKHYWVTWDALTIPKFLHLAYLKHEHCSQQYSVRHVFITINCYKQQAFSYNFICFTIVYEISFALHFLLIFSKNFPAISSFLYISRLNSQFFYISKLINSLRKYLQPWFVVQGFRFSSRCPIVGSPCWCRLSIVVEAICVMK